MKEDPDSNPPTSDARPHTTAERLEALLLGLGGRAGVLEWGGGGAFFVLCSRPRVPRGNADRASSRDLLHCFEGKWAGQRGVGGQGGAQGGHRLVLASSRIFQTTRCMQALASSLELCPSTLSWIICLR